MIPLQLVSQLQAGTSIVTPFQPWWEILIDYSLSGYLMTVVLGLAGVTLTGTSDIVCVPKERKFFFTDISVALYVNSRCSRTFSGSYLLYYPYVALVLYLVLLFGHVISVKLPSTHSFLSLMFELFADFKSLRTTSAYFGSQAVVTSSEDQRLSNEIQKGGKLYKALRLEVKEQVIGLVERLIAALQSDAGFFVVYVTKSAILFFGSGLVIVANVFVLLYSDWALVFDCDLHSYVAPLYETTTCTIPAAPFLYGLMVVSSAFAFFVLIFTIRAIAWLFQSRNFISNYLKSWEHDTNILTDLPGFRDFSFCLMLMKNNGSDGDAVYATVNSSIRIYTTLKIEQHFEDDQLLGTNVASDLQFERDNYICDFMLREMGLESKEAGESHDLIHTLSVMYKDLGTSHDGDEDQEAWLRKAVFSELVSHPTLYKDMIDSNKENLLTFWEYVKTIKNGSFVSGEISDSRFVLVAFSNLARLKIVVVRSHLCSFVFTPIHDDGEKLNVAYLKHVAPRDYIPVSPLDEASSEQLSNRNRFLESRDYAEEVHQQAWKSWKSTGYKSYLSTLMSRLPKYLTGTEDALDKMDGIPVNRPVMSHLTFLEDIGFASDEKEEEEVEEESAREDDGSVVITE